MLTLFQWLLVGVGGFCILLGLLSAYSEELWLSLRSLLGLSASNAHGGTDHVNSSDQRISAHRSDIGAVHATQETGDESSGALGTASGQGQPATTRSGHSSQIEAGADTDKQTLRRDAWFAFPVHQADYIADPFASDRLLTATPDDDPFQTDREPVVEDYFASYEVNSDGVHSDSTADEPNQPASDGGSQPDDAA